MSRRNVVKADPEQGDSQDQLPVESLSEQPQALRERKAAKDGAGQDTDTKLDQDESFPMQRHVNGSESPDVQTQSGHRYANGGAEALR